MGVLLALLTAVLAQDGDVDRILLRHGQRMEQARSADDRRKADADARAELEDFLKRNPKHADAPRAAWLRASSWLASGDLERGVAELRAFLAAHEGHELAASARLALAEALLQKEDWAGARAACALVLEGKPGDDRAIHARLMTAVAWQYEGDVDRAAALLRAVRNDFPARPESWGALMQLAVCFHAAERNADARKVLEEVIGGCPDRAAVEAARRHLAAYLRAGTEAPPLAGADLDGKPRSTADFAGKPLLLYFFDSSQPTSSAEAAFLRRLRSDPATASLPLLGVSLDRERRAAQRLKEEFSIDWPLLFDGKGYDGSAALAWDVRRLPSLWLIDKRGRLRHFNLAGADLRRAATKLLQE